MAPSWRLNVALSAFRAAVDARWPDRDRSTDGTIGDPAHASRDSDHNPDPDGTVDAWDMDVELNGVGKPYRDDVERLKRAFRAHPSARYWIHDDRIAHRSTGWVPRPYNPSDPNRNKHTKHVHWNSNQATETSRAPWVIEGDDVGEITDPTQRKQLTDGHWVLTGAIPNPVPGGEARVPMHVWAAWMTGAIKALMATVTSVANAVGDRDAVSDLRSELDELAANVSRYAEDELQRDRALVTALSELRGLLAELDAGTLTQDELVSRIRVTVEPIEPDTAGR